MNGFSIQEGISKRQNVYKNHQPQKVETRLTPLVLSTKTVLGLQNNLPNTHELYKSESTILAKSKFEHFFPLLCMASPQIPKGGIYQHPNFDSG